MPGFAPGRRGPPGQRGAGPSAFPGGFPAGSAGGVAAEVHAGALRDPSGAGCRVILPAGGLLFAPREPEMVKISARLNRNLSLTPLETFTDLF
jgi:hypothetical protein